MSVKIPTPTSNSVPSADIKDVVFAGSKMDEFATSENYHYTDRLGNERLTAAGMQNQFLQSLLNIGYEYVDDYIDGRVTFTRRNQITAYNGEFYRPKASVNLPYTTSGNTSTTWDSDKDNFVSVGDAALRNELSSPDKGDSLISVQQPFTGSDTRTQHDYNAERFSFLDITGNSLSMFSPYEAEALVRAAAILQRSIYYGYDQLVAPRMGGKFWKYLDGTYDRGTVLSVRNLDDQADTSEPVTQVLGISTAAGLSAYSDRDSVGLYVQMDSPPALFTSTASTFTATTVVLTDITAAVIAKLRKKQIIDVTDSSGNVYTSWIIAIDSDTNTITIDTAWYLKGSYGATTATPAAGSTVKIVPSTKVWAANLIASTSETSDATNIVGIELGLYNSKKAVDGAGYGYDCYSGGTYSIMNAFQSRGKTVAGFRNYSQNTYGFINTGKSDYGYYDSGSTRGLFVWNNAYGITVKAPTLYAFILQDNSNNFVTGMDSNGAWQSHRLSGGVTAIGATVSSFFSVTLATPATAGDAIIMPTVSAGKIIKVRNLSATIALTLTGKFEGGKGSFSIAAGCGTEFWSDGTYWYPTSNYTL